MVRERLLGLHRPGGPVCSEEPGPPSRSNETFTKSHKRDACLQHHNCRLMLNCKDAAGAQKMAGSSLCIIMKGVLFFFPLPPLVDMNIRYARSSRC